MKRTVKRIKDKLWVHSEGRTYQLPASLSKHSNSSASNTQELIAPFPCKILKIFVAAGDEVAIDQAVITVEAMKMEYTYVSPRKGEIAMVNVKVGQVVPEGTSFVNWKK